MQCQVIKLDDAEKLRKLPDGEYVSNAITSVYFKKRGDKFIFATCEKTAEEMVAGPWSSIVGPLIGGDDEV